MQKLHNVLDTYQLQLHTYDVDTYDVADMLINGGK